MRKFKAVSTMDVAIVLCIGVIFTTFIYKIGKFIIYKCQAYFDSMRIFLVYQKLFTVLEIKLSSYAELTRENDILKITTKDYSYYTYLHSQLSQYIRNLNSLEKQKNPADDCTYTIEILIPEANDSSDTQ